jgi:hypothetical protein
MPVTSNRQPKGILLQSSMSFGWCTAPVVHNTRGRILQTKSTVPRQHGLQSIAWQSINTYYDNWNLGNAVAKCIWRYRTMHTHIANLSGVKHVHKGSPFEHSTQSTALSGALPHHDTEGIDTAARKTRRLAGD